MKYENKLNHLSLDINKVLDFMDVLVDKKQTVRKFVLKFRLNYMGIFKAIIDNNSAYLLL